MTPLELAATVRALGDAVPFGSEIADALEQSVEQFEDDAKEMKSLLEEIEGLQAEVTEANANADEWYKAAEEKAGDQLAAYLVSLGLPAVPVTTEGYAPELRALIEAVYG